MKEVVHVPTRELAKEVLRVAKKQGLMKLLDIRHWEGYKTETYFRPNGYGNYANLSSAKTNGYKIITAEEFLDRYKPKFRPTAMRCNQEQFDAIKGKLVGCCLVGVSNFTKNIYLVNNFLGAKLNVSNVITPDSNDRQVFEEWNEKTFLEYCGIEVKDEVSELEQLRKENEELKQHYNNVEHELKQLNNELSKELGLVKKQLKEIQDQPKVGDICLFWNNNWSKGTFIHGILSSGNRASVSKGVYLSHDNCIKATDENIKAKIKELQDGN